MQISELWIIQYEGDVSFEARLNTAYDELLIGGKLTVDAAELIYSSVGIHCCIKDKPIPHEGKTVKNYLKIPFYE